MYLSYWIAFVDTGFVTLWVLSFSNPGSFSNISWWIKLTISSNVYEIKAKIPLWGFPFIEPIVFNILNEISQSQLLIAKDSVYLC